MIWITQLIKDIKLKKSLNKYEIMLDVYNQKIFILTAKLLNVRI